MRENNITCLAAPIFTPDLAESSKRAHSGRFYEMSHPTLTFCRIQESNNTHPSPGLVLKRILSSPQSAARVLDLWLRIFKIGPTLECDSLPATVSQWGYCYLRGLTIDITSSVPFLDMAPKNISDTLRTAYYIFSLFSLHLVLLGLCITFNVGEWEPYYALARQLIFNYKILYSFP